MQKCRNNEEGVEKKMQLLDDCMSDA